jgi:hypothetical protein
VFNPDGNTSMRDAIAEGAIKMLSLQALFVNSELQGMFRFVHVVLSDGEDNSSKLSNYQLQKILQELAEKVP